MKIRLTGKNIEDIRPLLPQYGLEETDGPPELIVCYGGDGSLLGAERSFPGIPKLPLRDTGSARLCDDHSHARQLQNFVDGKTVINRPRKLEVLVGSFRQTALNDIYIHNSDHASALRYQVWLDDQLYAEEIAGDAVGLSTVHGSSAYYRSITHSVFRVGLGLAFSNSMELVNHMVISEDSEVRIKIIRGPGVIIADNAPERIIMQENDEALLRQSEEQAAIYGLENFMCPKCRFLRHLKQYPFVRMAR
jgi:NAD+ kinase